MQPVEEYALESEEFEALEAEETQEEENDEWLAMARDAFNSSDNYYSSSIRKQIENNLDMFNSKHTSGSKYHTDSYKFRSKLFRPKTRSTIRRHETAASTAFFSTSEVIDCHAVNQNDQMALFGALVAKNLVNNRLQDPAMNWFSTCIGAYQDAMVQGCVISRQEWLYKTREEESLLYIDEDRPECELVPIENFRFDFNCDWRDPVASSPFLIELLPMYKGDVIQKMKDGDWLEVEEEAIVSSSQDYGDTRNMRTKGKQNPKNIKYENSDYDLVWVHRNILKKDDQDYIFYTLNTTELLSEPVLLEEEFKDGRPYVVGFCNIETHKSLPAAPAEMYKGLQQEANDIANQRMDNVKLAVNRRTFVRRNAKIDVRGLTQSVPGGITLVDDVDRDVRHDAPPDVTSSSYAEQDRLNNDFDELAGTFSSGSIAGNRAVNETVGGMELMNQDAASVTDYQLKIFSETWLKPVLRQLLMLEKRYESDPLRLSAAGNGQDPNLAIKAIRSEIVLSLAIGFGATNPQKQVEKLSFALNTIGNFMPNLIQKLKPEAILSEVFGALGYQDGNRFFDMKEGEAPEVTELKKQLQQLQQQLQQKQIEGQTKIQVETVKQQGNMKREQLRNQTQLQIAELDQDIDYIKQQIAAEKNDIARGELTIQQSAFDFSKKEKELEAAVNERNRMSDLLMRDDYGMAPNIEEKPGRG